jgi:hypothetical protein
MIHKISRDFRGYHELHNSGRGAKAVKDYATSGSIARIKRNTKRSLKRYRVLAKAIIVGRTGSETEELQRDEI